MTPALPVTRVRLRFDLRSPGRVGEFTGPAWRGGLGHALRRAACRTGAPTCAGCPHLFSCDYSLAFETPVPPGMPGLTASTAPHPFSLTTAPNAMGEQEVVLALYGSGLRFLAPLVTALGSAAVTGIGPDRVRLRLRGVECENPLGSGSWQPLRARVEAAAPATPPAPASARIRLHTPLRLRRRERYVGPGDFRFSDLFTSLLQRIENLCRLYGAPIEADFRRLAALAEAAAIGETDLRWREVNRYSSRQRRAIAAGGLLGSFVAELTGAPELWPWLWLGQFTQAGKGTALGFGQFTLEAIPCGN